MRVLIGCEENGKIRDAFKAKGADAWSCDLLDTRRPGNHYQCDIIDIVVLNWDLIILHPDCTKLAVSGNRWYGKGKERYNERLEAMKWTEELWEKAKHYCNHVVLENPIGVLGKTLLGKPSQYIHPWEYGHEETKKTCLWLHNVPKLKPTNVVEPKENRIWKMPPSKDRKRLRSETYDGWAKAMADQWYGIHIRC